MLQFKEFNIDTIQEVKKFFLTPTRFSCETNIVNLLVWQKKYANMYALNDGMLFIKSGGIELETYRIPFGPDLKKGFKLLQEYTGVEFPPMWIQQGERYLDFKLLFGEHYEFIPQRDAFDYIYLQSDLANLSGKKYHSKRNHISVFTKKYNWRSEAITEQNIPQILECMDEWYTQNADKIDELMTVEKEGIRFMLENMQTLNIKGLAIFVEDKAVAFTLGSPINRDVFDVHIEKALPEYATAYAVINNEFAKSLSDYKYINREDDLGLEGLRKAKLSYKPHILLKKYLCLSKKDRLKEIYHQAFADVDNTFEDALFDKCFDYCEYLEKDSRIVSMCFALPCLIDGKKAKYIFAVTTPQEFRGKGYAKELINRIKKQDDSILILRPVNDGLIPFYESLGFIPFTADNKKGEIAVEPLAEYKELAEEEKQTEGEFTAMYYSEKNCDFDGLYFPYSMP
jgi:hypothetical protein